MPIGRFLKNLSFAGALLLTIGSFGCTAPERVVPAHPLGGEMVPAGPVPRRSLQLILVTSADWEQTAGNLQRWERTAPDQPWRAVGDPVAVRLGYSGMGWGRGLHTVPSGARVLKNEGDGRSPAGVFELTSAFGAGPAGRVRIPYTQTTAPLRCVDDANSKVYNRLVDSSKVGIDWSSAEEMIRADGQYRLGIVVAHNIAPTVPGGGSCIFLHVRADPDAPTLGCTSMALEDLETVAAWLAPDRFPVLVQLPAGAYDHHKKDWMLP